MIKNKNGDVYVLDGPNKLAAEQVSWNMQDLEFYNFTWDDVYFDKKANPRAETSVNSTIGQEVRMPAPTQSSVPFPSRPIEIKPNPSQDIKIKEPEPEPEMPKPEPEPTPTHRTEPSNDSKWGDYKFPLLKRKVLMHCLPAKIKTGQDVLYGEKWTSVSYGEKFVFPSVVTQNSDLALQFWTTDPNNKLENKSIVFPFCYEVYNSTTSNYDRVPYDENRWWKISERVPKDIGWLFTAIPSADNPDFS